MSSLAELRDLIADEPWRADTYCLNADTDAFFPEKGDSRHVDRAKAICGRCPVTAECLESALKVPQYEDAGVWGGTSFKERAEIRRARGLMGRLPWGFARRGAA